MERSPGVGATSCRWVSPHERQQQGFCTGLSGFLSDVISKQETLKVRACLLRSPRSSGLCPRGSSTCPGDISPKGRHPGWGDAGQRGLAPEGGWQSWRGFSKLFACGY